MVRDVITHLLFAEDVAQDATSLADLDAGEILFIDKGGNPLNAAGLTALGDDDIFFIVEGKKGANLNHIISPRLTKSSIVAHRGTSFAAPVEQVSILGGAGGAINVVNNTEYVVNVSFDYDKDIYSERRDVRRFNYTSDGTASSAEIVAALVNLMNSDREFSRQAVAASIDGDTGISITGKALPGTNFDNPVQVKFNITLEEGFDTSVACDEFTSLFVNGTKGAPGSGSSISPTPGSGTYAKMKALERNGLGYTSGQTNQRAFPVVGPEARVSATGTYDVYVIDFFNEHESGDIGKDSRRKSYGQILIANNIATTVNGTTAALEAIFLAATGTAVNL